MRRLFSGLLAAVLAAFSFSSYAATISLRPVALSGFNIEVDGQVAAPIRLAVDHAIVADEIGGPPDTLHLTALRCRDTNAVRFAPDDYVSVTLTNRGGTNPPEAIVRFKLSLVHFDATRWQALFQDGPAPFHFLVCSLPNAVVWHQRGWLNATPKADPFPLLLDTHVGSPEISCTWNRNWSYLCALGGHPIPVIGLWDAEGRHYVGYDFSDARATDQSERYLATAYCWQQGATTNFITLVYPHGGLRYGQRLCPKAGDVLESHFQLVIDTALGPTDDPNERYQARLFAHHADALPAVPDRNDLAWVPGAAHSTDFPGPIGLDLFGPGGETTFYPSNTYLIHGWTGHREMPVATAVRRGDTAGLNLARKRIETLLSTYGQWVTINGEACLFWEKPLSGAWRAEWGGPPVTTMHNSDAWYAARVLVELYRYDRSRGTAKPEYLQAIDGLFNWTKHFVWTRNEFADVPSSPFAIGGTLSAAFLLDYYFTFKNDADPARQESAALALTLARNLTWRYLQIWGMDSDRFDDAIDGSFLAEPNSGRDWAGLACSNEVAWNVDTLTQVYVHTGDIRMRYYLRGLLQRWPLLYRPIYADSLAQYGTDSLTEGYGLFDGAGPGRGGRYSYGFAQPLPFNEPIGDSLLRVVAGARACIAFCKNGTHSDVTDYRTSGNGACAFRVVSTLTYDFDVSFSYPCIDISGSALRLTRGGTSRLLTSADVVRPAQSPSSIYFRNLRQDDLIQVGTLPADAPVIPLETPFVYAPLVHPVVRGAFTLLPVPGTVRLSEDWADLQSFAGLIPGERWIFGVPYHQGTNAATASTSIRADGATAIFVAYAPPANAMLTSAPVLTLDNGTTVALTGQPTPGWRGWPPIYLRAVLLDYARIPSGRSITGIQPNGTWVIGATAYQGDLAGLSRITNAFASSSKDFQDDIHARDQLLALRAQFATLPSGKIAILPGATAGAGANFVALTGLEAKAVRLTEAQMIDTNIYNPTRFPLTIYLNGERYIKTVKTAGDGKAAVTRYLAAGGTIACLASQPFPFYYGDGPNSQQGPADPLLPALGLPITVNFETPPAPLTMRVASGQTIVHSLPASFPFPSGDPRLRAVDRTRVSSAHRYTPLIQVQDNAARSYGDAGCYIEFGTGAAKGGRVLYLWSTLLESSRGNLLMADTMGWLVPLRVK